jgi:crotonobetainyl-CoA:carnitine CoA-transferase CaiB-like acyl-CoA transferase
MGWVVSNYLNAGVSPRPMGNQNFTAAPSGTFRTGDGLINIAANEDKQFAALCRVVGRLELATDARFAERQARKEHRHALNDALEAALAARPAAEWEPLLIDAGVPAGLVLDVPGVLAHEQVTGRDFVTSFPEEGQHVTRAGFRLSGDDPCAQTPAPPLSAHTDDWLTKLGYRPDQIEALRAEGAI